MATGDEITEEKTTPVGNEVSKVLPREKMIATAVHFLKNPKVANDGSMHQKKAFLLSKGLTEEEIALAFGKANVENPPARNPGYFPIVESPSLVHPGSSLWMRINHVGSSVVIIAVVCYGIHRIYKLYIEPWLFGEQRKEDRLTEMEHQLVELNRSLSQLRRSVGTIEDSITSQKAQLNKLCDEAIPSPEVLQNPLMFSDIKSEVASIKSLLLGRQRFPPAPNVAPTIPSWQLETSSEKIEEKNSCENNNESDSAEVEENVTAGPVSNGFEDNSVPEECSKSPVIEVTNSPINGEPEDTAADEVEA